MSKTNKKITEKRDKDATNKAETLAPKTQSITTNSTTAIIKFPTELTISYAEQFKSEVIDIINANNELLVDDSELVRIDTTGLQLIIAIITYILSVNKSLNWQCHAACINESVKQLGVNEPMLNKHLT